VRIRSTKPEFWKSNTIAELSWDERLVLKGLESYVDDNGVGKDDIELIATEVFPRDTFRNPRETLARLTEAISNIHRHGLIARYVADGEKLLYVDKWADIQRVDKPNRGRFPRPDGTLEYIQPVNRESYRNPRESFGNPPEVLAPVTGEQRNRGTEEKKARTQVQTEQHSGEAEPPHTPAIAATRGADLVRANIPKGHPNATLTSLRLQASELLNTGTEPDVVAEALRLWCNKPGVGIGRTILSSMCSEVIKSKAAQTNGANAKPHKMRALVELAQQTAAEETRTRKELPA
jgi:hypothetical protein